VKKIYTTPEQYQLGLITSVLGESEIEYVIRNEFLAGALGELPPHECWPEIWVTHDEDFDKAISLIEQASQTIPDQGKWQCDCGEENEGTFGSCWKCGLERKD
jgi:hypothetical protein